MEQKNIKVLKEGEEGYGYLLESDAGFISQALQPNGVLIENFEPTKFDLTKPVIVYATLQKYGVENRNGRIYPEDILKKEVSRYSKFLKMNNGLSSAIGELDHPDSSTISLKNGVPHRVIELTWVGNKLIGKLEILVSRAYRESGVICTDGDIVAHYLEYGITLGISSRGVGSLKKIDGKNMVQTDFELVCWDIVSSPSTYGSYMFRNFDDHEAYDEKAPSDKTINDTLGLSSKDSNLMNFLKNFN